MRDSVYIFLISCQMVGDSGNMPPKNIKPSPMHDRYFDGRACWNIKQCQTWDSWNCRLRICDYMHRLTKIFKVSESLNISSYHRRLPLFFDFTFVEIYMFKCNWTLIRLKKIKILMNCKSFQNIYYLFFFTDLTFWGFSGKHIILC